MPPAIIGGAIAAVGTIGGAVIASHSASSAANQANASQQAATQAQLQLGRENMSQQRDIYNANFGLLSPFVSRGNVAGESINALLGLPSAPAMQSPLAQAPSGSTGGASAYHGPSLAEIQAMQHDGIPGNYAAAMAAYNAQNQAGRALKSDATRGIDPTLRPGGGDIAQPGNNPASNPTTTPTSGPPIVYGGTGTAPGTGTTTNALTPQQAFENFAHSAGMDFQMKQGANALNNLYAGRGQLQSGAAMKAMQGYGQQTALNNYFMPYMNMLSGQQATGAQAGSAVAGVGSNFGNTAAGIYGQMGNAIGNGADAASNAALLRGQANSQMWNQIGGALGGLASSFFPSGRY